jgi:GDP-D-mannose dehydratase
MAPLFVRAIMAPCRAQRMRAILDHPLDARTDEAAVNTSTHSDGAAASRGRARASQSAELGARKGQSGLLRRTEGDALLGDRSKGAARLGWKHKTSFDALVKEIVKPI